MKIRYCRVISIDRPMPKEYHLFGFDSTAQCHCQTGGYAPASEFIMNWLEEKL